MFRQSTPALLVAVLALVACQTDQSAIKQPVGNLAVHAPVAAAPTTTMPAASTPTAPTDDTDQTKRQLAEKRASIAPIGQQITWNDPKTGNAGTITPVRDFYDKNGVYCREFQQTNSIGGKQQQTRVQACQQPDGGWKIFQ